MKEMEIIAALWAHEAREGVFMFMFMHVWFQFTSCWSQVTVCRQHHRWWQIFSHSPVHCSSHSMIKTSLFHTNAKLTS